MAYPLLNLGKMLSDESRIRVLNCLVHRDACVCELAEALNLQQTALSNHLAKLRTSGLVETNREGTWIYYSISKGYLKPISELIKAFSSIKLSQDIERLETRLALRFDGKCRTRLNNQKEN